MNNLPAETHGTEVSFIIPTVSAIAKLKELQPSFSLSMKYKSSDDWAALKDKELRAYFMGLKEIPNEDGELVVCAKFVTESECFIAGQKVLIEAVKNLPENTPLSITYRGKKSNKSSDGSTMLFDVITLA